MTSNTSTKFKETEIGSIPEKWSFVKSGDIFDIFTGKKDVNETVTTGKYTFFSCSPDEYRSNEYIFDGPAIIITGNGSYTGTVRFYEGKFDLYQRTYGISLENNQINRWDIKFLYFYFKIFFEREFMGGTRGSSIPYIVKGNIENFLVPILPIHEQRQIAEILSSLDDKIKLNRKINVNLEKLAAALFKKWFVDNVSGKLPDGWKNTNLGEFFPIKTGKKDANVATNDGEYPFFTCSQDASRTGEYSFDSSSILLTGNGDFNVKWYEGKFEAYQRTYVLTPYKKELLGFLFYLIKHFLNDITAGHRGSVIRFITKGMIEDFRIDVPDENTLAQMAKIFNEINQSIDFYKKEIENLVQIRDSLLPRLMNGKIRV